MRGQHVLDGGKGVSDESGVVTDILRGHVDFVGNARRELTDGFQFPGLKQVRFE